MSYGMSAALQQAVYGALVANGPVNSLSGGAIYDALPSGPVPSLYVSLGPERARDRSDQTGNGALHEFPVTVVSDTAGFTGAKALAAAVSDALVDADLTLSRGRLVGLWFVRARARIVDTRREVEVWFRARVDDGPG